MYTIKDKCVMQCYSGTYHHFVKILKLAFLNLYLLPHQHLIILFKYRKLWKLTAEAWKLYLGMDLVLNYSTACTTLQEKDIGFESQSNKTSKL